MSTSEIFNISQDSRDQSYKWADDVTISDDASCRSPSDLMPGKQNTSSYDNEDNISAHFKNDSFLKNSSKQMDKSLGNIMQYIDNANKYYETDSSKISSTKDLDAMGMSLENLEEYIKQINN